MQDSVLEASSATIKEPATELTVCIVCAGTAKPLPFCGHASMCPPCMHQCSTTSRTTSLRCPICRAPVLSIGGSDTVERAATLVFGDQDKDQILVDAIGHAKWVEPDVSVRQALGVLYVLASNVVLSGRMYFPPSRADKGLLLDIALKSHAAPSVAEQEGALWALLQLSTLWRSQDMPAIVAALVTPSGLAIVTHVTMPEIAIFAPASDNLFSAIVAAAQLAGDQDAPFYLRVLTLAPRSILVDALFQRILEFDEHDGVSVSAFMAYAHKHRTLLDKNLLKLASQITHKSDKG